MKVVDRSLSRALPTAPPTELLLVVAGGSALVDEGSALGVAVGSGLEEDDGARAFVFEGTGADDEPDGAHRPLRPRLRRRFIGGTTRFWKTSTGSAMGSGAAARAAISWWACGLRAMCDGIAVATERTDSRTKILATENMAEICK